jgi:flagellar protein FliO/FliZ
VSPLGTYLVETFVTLVLVVGVAVVVLVVARKMGVGGATGPMELVGRLPLDARRAIYLVKVGSQVLVVGASEGGLVKLGEMADKDLPRGPAAQLTFAEVLGKAWRRDRPAARGEDARGPDA